MTRRPRSKSESTSGDRSERGILRALGRLVVLVLLVSAVVLGAATFATTLIERAEDADGIDLQDRPDPSSNPPPAGERDPDVTDPDDPGVSSYETDVETVRSDAVEDFVHAAVNDRRADHGLESLEWDGTVASVSRAHSYDMAHRDYFSHGNPDGEGPYDRFSEVDDYCRGYGENIALTWIDRPIERPGNGDTVEYYTAEDLATGLVDQWMNSTSHREAILEEHGGPGWDRGGVGVYIADDGAVYASHNFCHEW
ncbi:CAP domain-containing protein [Natrarchaeobius halalkaliphilus]|uniref:CAP domain-containing protein n=1 Tax=Natrarchaeobius halalkaliphilus TaxID=1679091 RepID=A0A3N6M815_9EURY|nr:CAP domain-containing protein [Natrarchaeobius halalkaliphilus]RQG91501.1 CAP domain-containing protein [Natrarchaeobius halalkaliphilus]